MKILSRFYMFIIFALLYAPVVVMIIFSFNSSNSLSEFTGFSLRYYAEAFNTPKVMDAFKNTLILAVCTAAISGVLGTAAAVGISRMKSKYAKKSLLSVTNIPMMNPDIVTGVSMMLLFVFVGTILGFQSTLSFWTMLIAHVTFSLPYVILSIMPKIKQMDKHLPEAAMDLGCTPFMSFFKVELPCILPGVISGMLMAFTLSLDDFVISYFVKGTGFETLPIYIYSAVRKGVRPSLYAANTFIVVTVLILLFIINFMGDKDKSEKKTKNKFKKILPVILVVVLIVPVVFSFMPNANDESTLDYAETTYHNYRKFEGTELSVYNWGYYISDGSKDSIDVNAEFEKLTGIKVLYDNYDSNESLYTKLDGGGADYDIIIPSDYMIQRLINEDKLAELNYDNIPNYKYIAEQYRDNEYDPGNKYSVPYNVGMVGVIYNTHMVEGTPDSWSIMWDEKYSGKILNFNNSRDAFAIAQFYQGLDINSENLEDWDKAFDKLVEQKSLLQAYVMDEVFNKMESGEAAIAPYYAGDYLTMYENVEDKEQLAFFYPKEGTNVFIDAICIPKTSKNKEAAELYINFLMDPEIAKENAEYMYYASPNTAVIEDEEYIAFLEDLHPDAYEILYGSTNRPNDDSFLDLSPEVKAHMTDKWTQLGATMTEDNGNNIVYAICITLVIILLGWFGFILIRKKKRARNYN